MTAKATLPVVDVDLATLEADPYPTYAELRRNAPVAFVPAIGRCLVTRHQDVMKVLRDSETFQSGDGPGIVSSAPGSRITGMTLIDLNGKEHRQERNAVDPPLRPRVARELWSSEFETNTDTVLAKLLPRGEADLLTDLALPLVAMNVGAVLGLNDISPVQMSEWCVALVETAGNFADDPGVWARGFAAKEDIIGAVDDAVRRVRAEPDGTVISSMVHAKTEVSTELMYSNVMISISGGINEPSHAFSTAAYGMLANPGQRAEVEADPAMWPGVFDEAVRWVSPIGFVFRRVTRPVEIAGVMFEAGDLICPVLASANRDHAIHPDPDVFDARRTERNVAFSNGPHFCAGAHISREQVRIALAALFSRFEGLRLDPDQEVAWKGLLIRGPRSVPVRWDP